MRTLAACALASCTVAACGPSAADDGRAVVSFAGSALGAEGEILARQVARFERENPDIRVDVRRTPDDATQRHQLFVQWLAARTPDPDVLQLDVVWTPEFAAAGWLLPLGARGVDTDAFLPATIRANTWAGDLYALPWFVDAGMLYWRTDLLPSPPMSPAELAAAARTAVSETGEPSLGFVWQGARYEGLVTVFVEMLGAFGGRIMDDEGRVVVDSPEAVRALEWLRDMVGGGSPRAVLTWHEEEARFAFQNGRALLMRNWPYAYSLMGDSAQSRVAGRYAAAPIPAAPGGEPTAALGGAQLAVSAHSDVPDAAWRLVAYLTAPAQMLERAAETGQFPARPAVLDDPRLRASLPVPPVEARRVLEAAEPRPVTPIWSQLSELLQIRLHRALAGQVEPAAALRDAAAEMNRLVERTRVRELMATRRVP
ncbi:MAG TPA: ABC transporter substrate-binding protein [Gemmatimonadales bacterium]